MRRLTEIIVWSFAACAAAGVAHGRDQPHSPGAIQAQIGAQSLEQALATFSRQSGLQVIYASALVAGRQSPGAPAGLPAAAVLEHILSGTGLTFSWVNERTVSIWQRGSETSSGRRLPGQAISEVTPASGSMRLAQASAGQGGAEQNSAAERESAESWREPAEKLEEIVVTAQKRAQRMLDVPMSVAAMTGEALDEKGIKNISDLSYAVPSLSVKEGGPGEQLITIRGIGNGRGSSSLVGIYLDDAPVSSIPFAQIDLRVIDLERVEVLRGPQGTLYGEGSAGGTIRFLTKNPQLDRFSAHAKMSFYANEDSDSPSTEVQGILNLPLIKDVFGLRLAGAFEDTAGWIDQPAAGRTDINDNKLRDMRAKALWRVSDNLDVTLMAVVHKDDGGAKNLVDVEPVEESNYLHPVYPTARTPMQDDHEVYNLAINYDLGFATLLSATSYMDKLAENVNANLYQAAPASSPLREQHTLSLYKANMFSEELRLTSKGDGRWNWTTGLFYRDAQDDTGSTIDLAAGGTILLRNFIARAVNDSRSWAVFGDAGYALTDRLEMGAGLRYFEDSRKNTDVVTNARQEGTFNSLDPRVYLSFALAPDVKLYGNVAKGFRSGGFNALSSVLAGGPATFEPEEVLSYEAGIKSISAQGRFRADVSLFYSEYKDVQVLGLIPGFLLNAVTSNAGEAEIKGVEWELNWTPTDRLTLGLNGNLTDTELTRIGVTSTSHRVGDPIDYVPEYSYTISAAYAFPMFGNKQAVASIDYNVQDGTPVTNRSAGLVQPVAHSDTLTFLNASLALRADPWGFELFGQNLLDDRDLLFPSLFGYTAQARPRTVGLRMTYDFQ